MIKTIVTYDINSKNNPSVLTSPTRKVQDFKTKEVVDCVNDLNDTLDNLIKVEGNKRGAIGLSATQIGVDLAISAVTLGDKRYIFINPEIKEKNGNDRLFRIGCFSLYKYRAMVRYNDDIVIEYFDANGIKQELTLKGDQSCVVQHEMDHLVGDLLFANLENKEKDLFIPRESLYKDGNIPLSNHGFIFELRRKLGLNITLSGPIYYSSLFNDYTDYVKTFNKDIEKKKDYLQIIKNNINKEDNILEISNDISSISISLSKDGYNIKSLQIDNDMYELDKRINSANDGKVKYINDYKQIDNEKFDVIFTHDILETLCDNDLKDYLNKIMNQTNKLLINVPTIKIKSNDLRGNEHLKCANKWKKTINNFGYKIIDSYDLNNDQYLVLVITK